MKRYDNPCPVTMPLEEDQNGEWIKYEDIKDLVKVCSVCGNGYHPGYPHVCRPEDNAKSNITLERIAVAVEKIASCVVDAGHGHTKYLNISELFKHS